MSGFRFGAALMGLVCGAALLQQGGGNALAQPDAPAPTVSASAESTAPIAVRPEPAETSTPVPLTPLPPPAEGSSIDTHLHDIAIHGFVSEGAFVSTANDYIGHSSHGSMKLFEAGLNVSTEVVDRVRVGMQVFARDFGALEDPLRFDWAFLDYRWRSWLGLRAGIIRMPFGLYNEYADVDSARLSLLMPESVYPFRNRDVLLSHRGFALYGTHGLGAGGELDYQVWLGTLSIPQNALTLSGATLDSIDTKYVTGAQVFWHPPLDGLRVGVTAIRTSIDFDLTLSDTNVAALIMAGVVPADYRGALTVSQRPDTWVIGSAEYTRDAWLFAAEYSRAFKHQQSTLPAVLPAFDQDEERFYGMTTYRRGPRLEVGGYYSVHNLDANDRHGRDPKYAKRFYAFQRDLAATVRFDVNDHWLWKLEGHFMDGTADLDGTQNPTPTRYWGLFLLRTTVTF